MPPKAIETIYKGYRFRSRLEARWAVFFDALGIAWDYEPEGYTLSNGIRYLPDFYLPTFSGGMWCEVKPQEGDLAKATMFALDKNEPVWLCLGVPGPYIYRVVERGEVTPRGIVPDYGCGVPNQLNAREENRMYVMPCGELCKGGPCNSPHPIEISPCDPSFVSCLQPYYDAIIAARQARFEHGERPNIEAFS